MAAIAVRCRKKGILHLIIYNQRFFINLLADIFKRDLVSRLIVLTSFFTKIN
jgi:hypothetical protein